MALTKLNNKAVANITTLPVALGDMVLVSSATASSSASIEFSLGNYKEYKFFFVNIHPATPAHFQFQSSTDNGSSYGVTLTSTACLAYQGEDGSNPTLDYNTSGVIMLTNDGEFSNYLTHPKNGIEREYTVKIDKPLELEDKEKLLKGIYLDNRKSKFTSVTFPKKNIFKLKNLNSEGFY